MTFTMGYEEYGKMVMPVRVFQMVYIAYKIFKTVKLKILFNSRMFNLGNFVGGDIFVRLHLFKVTRKITPFKFKPSWH